MDGEVSVITGGTGGLGREVARRFAARGHRLAITYLVPAEADEVEELLGLPDDRLLLKRVDCTDGAAVNSFVSEVVARFGGVNVTACLIGRDGGEVAAKGLADHCLIVPHETTARIQEMHIFLGHLLCAAADEAFTPKA